MKLHSSAKLLSSMVSNFGRASEVHLLTKVLLCLLSTLSFVLVSRFFFSHPTTFLPPLMSSPSYGLI